MKEAVRGRASVVRELGVLRAGASHRGPVGLEPAAEERTEVSGVACGKNGRRCHHPLPPCGLGWGTAMMIAKTIFAEWLRLLQGTSIIDALGIVASFPGEAVEHRVRQVGRGRE